MSIKSPCDLAVVAVPAPGVVQAIRDCGKAGIPFAVVLTAGFRESGAEGRKLEEELKRALAETGVRIVGPNCQGMLSVEARVWTVFGSVSDETELKPGSVSCAFQSGGFGYAIVNLAEAQGVGFRYCVSSGNEVDITTPELLSAFLDDPGTSLAFAYLEGTPDARRLLDLGRKSMETGKPVLIWKAGTTDAGIKAAASHTANMTGSYDLYRAAMRQCGLIEVDDVEPIVDIAKLFAQGREPGRLAIGVLSISGGSGVVFADAAVRGGLTLPPFAPETLAKMRELVPAFGSPENPADITAAVFTDATLFARTLDVVLEDPGLDQLSILLASISGPRADHSAEVIAAAAAKTKKPVHVAWSGRQAKSEKAVKALEAAGVPFVTTPVRLARAAAVLARFAADRRRLLPRKTPSIPKARGRRPARGRRHPQRGREQGGAAGLRRAGRERGVRGRRPATWRRPRAPRSALRGQGRVARRAAQDRGRRRQARGGAGGAERSRPVRGRQRAQSRARRQASTACWCRRWRKASRR